MASGLPDLGLAQEMIELRVGLLDRVQGGHLNRLDVGLEVRRALNDVGFGLIVLKKSGSRLTRSIS